MKRTAWERRLRAAASEAWGEPAEGLRVLWWDYYLDADRAASSRVVQWAVRIEGVDQQGESFTPSDTRRRAAVLALSALLRDAGDAGAADRLANEWPGLTGDERWLLGRGKPFCAVARSQGRGDLWLWEHLRERVDLP